MPDCQKLRPTETYSGKQGFDYFEGIAKETVGSQAICMHLLTIHRVDGPKRINMRRMRPRFTSSPGSR